MEHAGQLHLHRLAAALFILSLKWMNSPATARRGVIAGEIGMLLAVVGTLLRHRRRQLRVDSRRRSSSAPRSACRWRT